MTSASPLRRRPIAWWAVLGILVPFGEAIARLGTRGLAVVARDLHPAELVAAAAIVIAFVYIEGVRALQRRFAPMVVARAHAAAEHPQLLLRLLAPLFAIGLVGGPRRTTLHALAGIAAIAACIVAVRHLPSPWHEMIDLGVACALAWGAIALLVAFLEERP